MENINIVLQSTPDVEIKLDKGADGHTPYIGSNNNWWINNKDTLVLSRGDKGEKGDAGIGIQGVKGDTGKSSYQIAKENGYKDTEAQFGIEQATIAGNSARLTAVEATKQDKPIAGRTFLTPLFVARGAVFNDKTGFYELNGLVDITEDQMMAIYNQTAFQLHGRGLEEACFLAKCRTNFKGNTIGTYMGSIELQATFANTKMEVITFILNTRFSTCILAFANSTLLHTIPEVFSLTGSTDRMFLNCIGLENINLDRLLISVSFASSPKLTRASIIYMITNAINKSSITLTLHETAKARLTEEDIALAVSKNITIA